jgi:hypothetical protein
MKNTFVHNKKVNPLITITESIIANGRIESDQILPHSKANEIKQALIKRGYQAGLSLTKPESHFTGIQAGSTFYLWAVPPFTCKKG